MSCALRRSWPIVAIVAISIPIQAAQTVDPKKAPGSWKPFPASSLQRPYQAPPWLTPAIVKELGAHLAEVAEVFHRTPFLASPVGWVMFQHPQVHLDRSWPHPTGSDPRWVVAGRLGLRASHFEDDGRTVFDTGSKFALNLAANDLSCALNNAGEWATDAEGAMFREVEAPAENVHGFPRYQQCVLITHRPAPMFVPVALERVIKVRIAEIDKAVAKVRDVLATTKASGVAANASATETLNDAVAAYDQVVKDLRTRLAGLSPEQRRAPAFATSDVFSDDPLTFDAGRRIVEANPAFFNPARPSDIQVLTLFNDCVNDECPNHEVVAKVIAQLDWSALAAIVR